MNLLIHINFHACLPCQESDDTEVEVDVDEEDNENHVSGVQAKSVSSARSDGGWCRKENVSGWSLFYGSESFGGGDGGGCGSSGPLIY